jgi:tetratricopeptide (TPR) repeat protein
MSHANRQIDAHLQYGRRLHGAGRLAEAGQVYQQVLAAAPLHADALDMMGVLLLQMGQPAQALPWFQQAIRIKGTVADFHVHHAHALLALGRAAEAATASRTALRLKRGNAEAHQVLGRALTETADYAGALKEFQDAVRLKPDLLDGLNDLGTALHHANRLEEAARTLARAVAREPKEPGILLNLSSVLKSLGRFEEAENRLTAALRLAPADPRILYNYSLLMLLLGRFAAAWPGWEQRFRAGAVPDRGLAGPIWRGEKLAGRTLLVHAEQGLGDTIQFCRFPLPTDGAVVLEVQPRIARLLGSLRGAPRIVRAGETSPAFDLTCPLMSLPVILGTTLNSVPHDVPYLSAEPDAVTRWRTRLGDGGFRVGIAWQGNPTRREDGGRSIPLEHYLPLASVPDVRLVSLQKDDGEEQLAPGMTVETLGDDFDSGPDGFIDTAAVMMNLDLVITSDTAIAHLAGALGRPVWVALRAVPDWRWLLERTDSPWYPTMRLFRQSARDEWGPVFMAMRDALAALVAARHG